MEFARALLLTVHLLCVNVAGAGPLVAIWLDWQEGRGNAAAGRAGRYLSGAGVVSLIVGGALGIVLGALAWNDEFLAVLVRLSSRVALGAVEWVVSLVIMTVHLAWWRRRPMAGRAERAARCVAALAAGTNLLYHFPVLFSVIQRLDHQGAQLSRGDFHAQLLSGFVLSRVSHVIVASFAVVGVALIGHALRLQRQGDATAESIGRGGALLAMSATIAQFPLGFWMVLMTPRLAQMDLMGRDPLSSALFLASIGGAMYLLHQTAKAAFQWTRPAAIQSMIALVLVVFMMTWVSIRAKNLPRENQPTPERSIPLGRQLRPD